MYNYSIWLLYPVLRKLPHTHTHTHNCTIVAEVLHIFCYLLEPPLHWSSTSITLISCTYTREDIHDQFSAHRGYNNKRTVTTLHKHVMQIKWLHSTMAWEWGQTIASFPGSPGPEREHWSCAGRRKEPGIFFSHENPQRLMKWGKETLIAFKQPEAQNWQKSEGSGQLSTCI